MNEAISIMDAAEELGWTAEELGWTVEALIDQRLLDGLLFQIEGELVAGPHPAIQSIR